MNGVAHGHDLLRSHTHALRSSLPFSPSSPPHNYECGLTSFAAVLFIASRKRRNNDAGPYRASSFYPRHGSHPSRGGALIWFISKIRLPNRRTDPRSHMYWADRKLTALTNWYEWAFTRYEIGVRRGYDADVHIGTLVFSGTDVPLHVGGRSRHVFL